MPPPHFSSFSTDGEVRGYAARPMPGPATIHVTFVDAATDQPLSQEQLPAERLTTRLEAATTFEFGAKTYRFVSATPRTAEEIHQQGTAVVVVRRLYSLPTHCGGLPAIEEGSSRQDKEVLELQVDEWRQIEFVTRSLQEALEAELSAIKGVRTGFQRQGRVFETLHVRERLPRPLEGAPFTLGELRAALGEDGTWLEGLALEGSDGLVAGGFATRLGSGIALYGIHQDERLSVLGLHRKELLGVASREMRLLASLAAQRQLCLVDWCAARQVPATAQDFYNWMVGE